MSVATRADLPGVYIRHVEPQEAPKLPPLDVAAFVGFAQRGPVDVPVRVEDAAELERWLGADTVLPVTMPDGSRRWIRPYLRRAAEAFLENGGRRCYVVRLAGDAARRARFSLSFPASGAGGAGASPPASPAVRRQDTGEPLDVRASSEGTWANALELRTRLRPVALRRTTVTWDAEARAFQVATSDRWRAGDLLRVTDQAGLAHLYIVERVFEEEDENGARVRRAAGRFLVAGSPPYTAGAHGPRRVETLTFDLEVRGGGEVTERLEGLGFAPGHARYALDVLRERSVYLDAPEPRDEELLGEDSLPAPVLYPDDLPVVGWSLPVTPREKGADDFQGLSPELFAPRELERLTRAGIEDLTLRAQEEAHRTSLGGYVPDPVRLRGLLSVLPIDEVALVAAPDALRAKGRDEPPADLGLDPAPPTPAEPEPCPSVGFVPCPGPGAQADAGDHEAGEAGGRPARPDALHLPEQWSPAYLEDEDIRRVQRAMIHLCELRGNMVAVLAAPRGRDASTWRWQVMERDLNGSYAAFYHPWVRVRGGDGDRATAVRLIPPDGPACGAIARRERMRGVWIAPANEPLRGVLGLGNRLSQDEWARFLEHDINVVRAHPGDFRIMSARTLSPDRHLSQLNVRRLLIALRKALLRWGMDFVFETHSHGLRSAVRLRIEHALEDIYRFGAFAGPNPETSFQVVVDEAVNPLPSVDGGRLVALVKVAPSWPMEFLEVHLVRTGEGLLQLVEA